MSADPAKKLASLMKRLRSEYPEAVVPAAPFTGEDGGDPIVRELIFSMMLWESSTEKALEAYARVHAAFVDDNELRVSYAEDIAQAIGGDDPMSLERAERLRAALMDIYKREHHLALRHHVESAKRDAKGYMGTLDGLPGFVRARLLLLWWGSHAMPVDNRLAALLADEGAIEQGGAAAEAASFLERNIKAGETREAHALMQAWSDADGGAPAASAPGDIKARKPGKSSVGKGGKRPRAGS